MRVTWSQFFKKTPIKNFKRGGGGGGGPGGGPPFCGGEIIFFGENIFKKI